MTQNYNTWFTDPVINATISICHDKKIQIGMATVFITNNNNDSKTVNINMIIKYNNEITNYKHMTS